MLEEKIKEIERMGMPELQQQFKKYFGWDCKARNKEFLRSRLIYRLQELTFGGLSSTTKFLLYQMAIPTAPIHLTKGSVLEKTYKGKLYRITVGQDHFTMDGKVYKSLSAIAHTITGQRLSGNRFFKIDERKS